MLAKREHEDGSSNGNFLKTQLLRTTHERTAWGHGTSFSVMDPIAKERIVTTNTIRMGMTLFRGFQNLLKTWCGVC
jgi:hypothetical protein